MSAALVPGRILLVDPLSSLAASSTSCVVAAACAPGDGDDGPSWTSGKGGGLGSRGEVEGDMLPAAARVDAMISTWLRSRSELSSVASEASLESSNSSVHALKSFAACITLMSGLP